MNTAEIKLGDVDEYQDIILFMKNMALIKDNSRK